MKRLIVILGPTAVGKTKLSIELAQRLNTEIISGDSMLIYRGFDIGTAKPTEAEKAGIPHHLIDILAPADEYTVVDFQKQAALYIETLNHNGKIPILAGGTGLYVKALLENYQFHEAPSDEAYRAYLTDLAAEQGNEHVLSLLAAVNPQLASRYHPNDLRRIIRQLEIHHLQEQGITTPEKHEPTEASLCYDAIVIGLQMERSLLYARINERVTAMLEAGWVEEVRQLLQQGLPRECQALQAIGYKEVIAYLDGALSYEEMVRQIQQTTRHFAKRQLTWYRKMPYIEWFDPTKQTTEHLVEKISQRIAQKFNLK
ncbi:MAG: tRNA (adenosine(37)-N6)-dimethylallyltransferase MiaA [Sporomusaceae bacterium]|nr:tRNA (adenosine(37)-N6)-dimethylallyltransferase MiaA [Sporomusaceae bacterium]